MKKAFTAPTLTAVLLPGGCGKTIPRKRRPPINTGAGWHRENMTEAYPDAAFVAYQFDDLEEANEDLDWAR